MGEFQPERLVEGLLAMLASLPPLQSTPARNSQGNLPSFDKTCATSSLLNNRPVFTVEDATLLFILQALQTRNNNVRKLGDVSGRETLRAREIFPSSLRVIEVPRYTIDHGRRIRLHALCSSTHRSEAAAQTLLRRTHPVAL